MKFYVVENRTNETIAACVRSAHLAGVNLQVLTETEAGSEYQSFCENYVHLSDNSAEFERICFRRYFILRNAMEKSGERFPERFVLIDSDVLLFPGVDAFIQEASGSEEFAGSMVQTGASDRRQISPHVSYWTAEALVDFVNFLRVAYRPDGIVEELRRTRIDHLSSGQGEGISDMSLLYFWAKQRNHTVYLNSPRQSGVIDHNISIPHNAVRDEYRSFFGAKIVRFKNGLPYIKFRNGGETRVFALHFQGKAKMYMRPMLERRILMTYFIAAAIRVGREVRAATRSLRSRAPQ